MANTFDLSGNEDSATNMCALIEEFNGNPDLQGDAWGAIKAKLKTYQSTFKSFRDISSNITSIFSFASKQITTAIDNYVSEGGTIPIGEGLNLGTECTNVETKIKDLEKEKAELEADLATAYAVNRAISMGLQSVSDSGSSDVVKPGSSKKVSTLDISNAITAKENEISQYQKYLALIQRLIVIKDELVMPMINDLLLPPLQKLENSVNDIGGK